MNSNDHDFERFIKFGHFATKEQREYLVRYFLSLISSVPPPDRKKLEDLKNYTQFIDNFYSQPEILSISKENQSIGNDISKRILETLSNVQKKFDTQSPFLDEELMYNKAKNSNLDEFLINIQDLFDFLKKEYKKTNLNCEFFRDQLMKLNEQSNYDKNEDKEDKRLKIEALKNELLERWNALLTKKKHERFLEELDDARKKLVKEILEQIEKFRKMMKILKPFSDECGRLWDLSKGNWKNVGFELLEKYAELLENDKELQKLAEILGRMHEAQEELVYEQYKEKIIKPITHFVHAGKSELIGVHESDDISNLLPVELSLLGNDSTELIFYKKFAEKKLLTYQFIGQELGFVEDEIIQKKEIMKKKEKLGPIIICVDTSGSMHGTPEYVAKILCFAVTRIALLGNRKCYLISFSTDIATIELTDFNRNFNALLNFLSMSFHGGTDATPALREALRMLETKTYENADVLMISDFIMNSVDQRTLEAIKKSKEKGTKFHSLVISNAGNIAALDFFDNNWIYTDYGSHEFFKSSLKNMKVIGRSKIL